MNNIKHTKKLLLVLLPLMIVSLFWGCNRVPSTLPITENTDSHSSTGLLQEQLSQTPTEPEATLHWNIPEDAQLVGNASTWSYSQLDCFLLWDSIVDLFPDAQTCIISENPLYHIELTAGEQTFSAQIGSDGISISGLDAEESRILIAQIADLLTERTGFDVKEYRPDIEEGIVLRYGFYLDGIPIDPDPTGIGGIVPASTLYLMDDNSISIAYPLCVEERRQDYDLSQLLTMAELQFLCDLRWESNGYNFSGSVDTFELVYMVDPTTKELVPGWCFLGQFQNLTSSFAHDFTILIHGITGEIIRFM